MNRPTIPPSELAARRQRARRTAAWFGLAAVAVYLGFLLINALSR